MMATILACAYIALSAYGALGVTRFVLKATRPNIVRRTIVFALAFFVLFFGSFLLLGTIALLTRLPLVRQDTALLLPSAAAIGTYLFRERFNRAEGSGNERFSQAP